MGRDTDSTPCHLPPSARLDQCRPPLERFAVLTTATESCNEAGAERDLQVQGVFQGDVFRNHEYVQASY